MPKFERYRLVIANEDCGTEFIALVDEPAHSEKFVYMGKNAKGMVFFVDEKKYELTGPIAIPNKNIYRSSETGRPCYVFFEEKDIVQQRDKFANDGNHQNINIMHLDQKVDGTLVESWIIDDSNNDKSAALGFNLPVGTWMGTVKIHDKKFWADKIETKEVQGFSLQGNFGHVPVGFVEFKNQIDNANSNNMSKNKNSPWDELWAKVKAVASAKSAKDPAVKMTLMRRDDRFITGVSGPLKGKTVRMFTDAKGYAFQETVEGETVAIPDGQYDGMDGAAIDVAEGVATQVASGETNGDEMMGCDTADPQSDDQAKKENMQDEKTYELVGDNADYLLQVTGDGSAKLIDADGNVTDAPDDVYETQDGMVITVTGGKVATVEKETTAEMRKDVNMRKFAVEMRKHKMEIRKMNASRDVKIDAFIATQNETNAQMKEILMRVASVLEIDKEAGETPGVQPTDARSANPQVGRQNHRRNEGYKHEPASQDFLEEFKRGRTKAAQNTKRK